jgi:peptide/nickel transport system substrate-binding protein
MAWKRITAVAATIALALTACGNPSDNTEGGGGEKIEVEADQALTDVNAKGPARKVEGVAQGGTITILSDVTPSGFDPTDNYYVDASEISKLFFRTLTTFDIRGGKPTLVPDLAEDLGTVSDDKLTWTFKLKKGMKYHDGTPVKAADYAYAIKRSFAHDIYSEGPAYQLALFKDGDKYKGPYGPQGDTYTGVETPDDNTLVIHLAKPFPDLPFYASFPMFTPIPKEKDTKQNYEKSPMTTGPYTIDSYQPGVQLKLKKNPNWDANSDPVRHQFVDNWVFKFGLDLVKSQRQVIASSGADANALNYSNIDVTLLSSLKGEKEKQLVKGWSPCTNMFTMDSRRIPLEVRKAIAKAFPFDQNRKVAGLTALADPAATGYINPSVQGFEKYEVPGLTGTGPGDPAAAKKMLQDAGKEGFELQWYYANDDTVATQVSQARAQALEKAGFKVKQVGVPGSKIRKLRGDQNGPVNIGKTPAGWCSDWPLPSSWFRVLFHSKAIEEGNSVGQLTDKALDAEIEAYEKTSLEDQVKNAAKLDRKILEQYLPALPISFSQSAFPVGSNIVNAENDPVFGMPHFSVMGLKQV